MPSATKADHTGVAHDDRRHGYDRFLMRLVLTPWSAGFNAARHLRWFLSYQVSGETRPASADAVERD